MMAQAVSQKNKNFYKAFNWNKLKPQTKKYLVIGASIYLLELLIITLAQYLGANSVVAVAISFWIGLGMSFTLQKIITFDDKRMHHKVIAKQIFVFGLLVIINFGFTILLIKLLTPTFPAVISRSIALAITTSWNFYIYKKRIFTTEGTLVY
jgi:putative flippase GtrA